MKSLMKLRRRYLDVYCLPMIETEHLHFKEDSSGWSVLLDWAQFWICHRRTRNTLGRDELGKLGAEINGILSKAEVSGVGDGAPDPDAVGYFQTGASSIWRNMSCTQRGSVGTA